MAKERRRPERKGSRKRTFSLQRRLWPCLVACVCGVLLGGSRALAVVLPGEWRNSLNHTHHNVLEVASNGTLILRGWKGASSGQLPQTIAFKTLVSLLKQAARPPQEQAAGGTSVKIYGDGVEHKFPPFIERLLQRIQTYFSVYKYADTSRPAGLNATTIDVSPTAASTAEPPKPTKEPSSGSGSGASASASASAVDLESVDNIDFSGEDGGSEFIEVTKAIGKKP